MKQFDSKWQECAARARQAPPQEAHAPLGFAARVAARSVQTEALSTEAVWLQLTVRSLAGVLALLALCALLEWPHLNDQHPLAPGIENTVAQILWSL